MLPTESLQEAFFFLSRDNLDAVQLVSRSLKSVVVTMPGDSPVRHFAWIYLKKRDDESEDSEESVQVEFVRDKRDIGKKNPRVECTDVARFVRNSSISNLSFCTLFGSVDWTILIDNLRCLKPLLSSTCVHFSMLGVGIQLPPPGPLLRSLFEDVLDTRVGLNFSCAEIDVGRGDLLRLPSLRASTELILSAGSPVIDNVGDVEYFIDWLHAPTDGPKAIGGHPTVPLPTHPRRLVNLKLTDDAWDTFRERILERFEHADRMLIFTSAVVFPGAAHLPLFGVQRFENTQTDEFLQFRVTPPMYGMTARHVLVSRGPAME